MEDFFSSESNKEEAPVSPVENTEASSVGDEFDPFASPAAAEPQNTTSQPDFSFLEQPPSTEEPAPVPTSETSHIVDVSAAEANVPEPVEETPETSNEETPQMIWRREMDKKLAEEREKEKAGIEKMKEEARLYRENFEKERQEKIEKNKRINREQEAEFLEARKIQSGGCWDRVLDNIPDLQKKNDPEAKDVSRMRTVLLKCKNDPNMNKSAAAEAAED